MKTENIPEEKARFLAQYYCQRVLRRADAHNDRIFEVEMAINLKWSGWYAELLPLSAITDEDARELGVKLDWEKPEDFKEFFTGFCKCEPQGILQIDFFRSKGYLLPYLDLSTKDLLAYGWAKEKEL